MFLATFLGRTVGHAFAYLVALYFMLASRSLRSRSQTYLARVFERSATFAESLTHIWTFARCVFDAFLLAAGRIQSFRTTAEGHDYIAKLTEEGRGALLVGSHLGSFYALRARSKSKNVRVYALVFTQHAQRLNEALRKLDPQGHTTLIELEKENIAQIMLRVRDLIENGALVAILADRVSVDEKRVEVQFLGETAYFPAGPFLLAATLRCPVYLTFGFLESNGNYHCVCEPLADPLSLPRGQREQALAAVVTQYAARLEHFAKKYPYNWFNFFDFWSKG